MQDPLEVINHYLISITQNKACLAPTSPRPLPQVKGCLVLVKMSDFVFPFSPSAFFFLLAVRLVKKGYTSKLKPYWSTHALIWSNSDLILHEPILSVCCDTSQFCPLTQCVAHIFPTYRVKIICLTWLAKSSLPDQILLGMPSQTESNAVTYKRLHHGGVLCSLRLNIVGH